MPFYAVSASEFVEMFVGRGAARVRELFATARKYVRFHARPTPALAREEGYGEQPPFAPPPSFQTAQRKEEEGCS